MGFPDNIKLTVKKLSDFTCCRCKNIGVEVHHIIPLKKGIEMYKSENSKISVEEFDNLFETLKNWNRWGEDDSKGTLNYITLEKVKAAAALVKSGRSVSMAIPMLSLTCS